MITERFIPEKALEKIPDSRNYQPMLQEVSAEFEVTREMFGPGKSGERSYRAVISAREILLKKQNGEELTEQEKGIAEMDACFYKDSEGNRCNNLPTGTINYDILANDEMTLICSREHGDTVEEIIDTEFQSRGRPTVPSRNGWGKA
jgi:hypothetical protein